MRRIVDISFNPSSIKFDTDEQYDAFQKALGYLVMFGMAGQDEDWHPSRVQVASINIAHDREMVGVYRSAVQLDMWDDRDSALGIALCNLSSEGCFVLGGVPNDEGKSYSFHS